MLPYFNDYDDYYLIYGIGPKIYSYIYANWLSITMILHDHASRYILLVRIANQYIAIVTIHNYITNIISCSDFIKVI